MILQGYYIFYLKKLTLDFAMLERTPILNYFWRSSQNWSFDYASNEYAIVILIIIVAEICIVKFSRFAYLSLGKCLSNVNEYIFKDLRSLRIV